MSSKRQFDDLHVDTHQVSMSVSGAPMYSDSTAFSSPWTGSTSYQYPSIMTSGPDGLDYNTTWAYTSTSENHPSLFSSSTEPPTSWPAYGSTSWTPSVNPSSASVYSHPISSTATNFSSATNSTWNPSDQASLSAYSEPTTYGKRPSLSRSVSADNTNTNTNTNSYLPYNSTYSPSTARMSSTAPASPAEYLTSSSTASTASQSKKRTSKPSSSKTKPSSKPPSDKPSTTSKSRKSTTGTKPNTTLTTTELDYEAQLLARFGHMMPPLTNTMSPSEQIRREAWRICKSEAMEMSQRRMKLLEHEHGALERETQKLQANIGQLRDAITEETKQLEVALAKAERLSASY